VANRVFKITLYVEADPVNPDVLQEEVERSVFRNISQLLDPPYVIQTDCVSAEEVSYEEYSKHIAIDNV